MNETHDRLEAAVRNILSGGNACGTLLEAARRGDGGYFRQMIAPFFFTYEQEADALRRQRDDALRDAETKRFALEMAASNLDIDSPDVRAAFAQALPGRKL